MNDKIGELLQKLADRLGVTIDHLWAVLVAQVKNQIVTQVLWYLALLAFTVVLIVGLNKLTKWIKSDDGGDGDFYFIHFIGIAIGLLLWGLAISSIGTFLAMFNNPEYVALKNLLGMIGGE